MVILYIIISVNFRNRNGDTIHNYFSKIQKFPSGITTISLHHYFIYITYICMYNFFYLSLERDKRGFQEMSSCRYLITESKM